jgi:hypothetical protein
LNSVDPKHYGGWSGALNACEFDARDYADICQSAGFTTKCLMTRLATRTALEKALNNAAKTLKKGDILCLTYSGHGGQLPDRNNDEDDGLDETWCLFDGEMVDDELYALYSKFAAGVRLLVISDSCHSGSVIRESYLAAAAPPPAPARFMPSGVAARVYEQNRKFYDGVLARSAVVPEAKATILLLSGCQDNQVSLDGAFNGQFTGTLKRVWRSGQFAGGYRKFWKDIVRQMPPSQTPNFRLEGAPMPAFVKEKPFTV